MCAREVHLSGHFRVLDCFREGRDNFLRGDLLYPLGRAT